MSVLNVGGTNFSSRTSKNFGVIIGGNGFVNKDCCKDTEAKGLDDDAKDGAGEV